ncbi:MAG: BON domain-containing protein [Pseudomonadota bacterium]|jgi:osmotically-inducible protein OsmY
MSPIFNIFRGLVLGCSLVVAGEALANPGIGDGLRTSEVQPYNRSVDQVLRGIKSKVRDAKYEVKVTDLDSFILLEGEVDSERSRSEVLAAAHASTSKRVRDELRVRPAPSDSQIADQVRGALRQDCPQLVDRVQVDVRGGVAYLSGDLRNHREVDELLATTLMVQGVIDIKSDITLAGRPYATQRMRARR